MAVKTVRLASKSMAVTLLSTAYWLSKFSDPFLCYIPTSFTKKLATDHGRVLNWEAICIYGRLQNPKRLRIVRNNLQLTARIAQSRRASKHQDLVYLPNGAMSYRFVSCSDKADPTLEFEAPEDSKQ